MECPRCGADMETYSLGGREAQACGSCNYVGVPVEHQSERETPESWADALSRFEEQFTGSVGETSVAADAADLAALVGEGGDDEDDDVAAVDPDEESATADDGEESSADAEEGEDEPEEKPDDEPEVAADGAPDPAASSDSGATNSGPDRAEKRRKRR